MLFSWVGLKVGWRERGEREKEKILLRSAKAATTRVFDRFDGLSPFSMPFAFVFLVFSRNRWNSSPLSGTTSPKNQTAHPAAKEKTRRRPRGEVERDEEEEEGASSMISSRNC